MAETANVEILINAFTDAAEEALDDVSDQLLDLSVSGQPAQSIMDEVADELDDATTSAVAMGAAFEAADGKVNGLTAAMALLANRADEAGDEILSAGGKAGASTGLFSALTLSTEGLSLSMGSLSTKIMIVLLPALAALLTTLFPLAAILGTVAAAAAGLAGAFGAVIGTGILAFGDKLAEQNQERLEQINDEIQALKELEQTRAGLTEQEATRLEQAKETISQLEQKREATDTLTDAQQAQLDRLKETRDALLEQSRAEDGLSRRQQARLQATRSSIESIRSLQQSTGSLTAEERRRLDQARQTVQALQEQKSEEGSLTEQEQKRLDQLKEKRDELKEQTSVTGALADRMAELKKELAPILIQFGQQFIPLIEDAIGAIPTLITRIIDAMGGMDGFASALRDAGQAAMTALPALVSVLMGLARDALPVLMDLGAWLIQNGGRIFEQMVATTRRLAPHMMSLIDAAIQATPALNRIGTVVLEQLIPALDAFLRVITGLVGGDWSVLKSQLGATDEGMRALKAGVRSLMRGIDAMMPTFRALAAAFQKYIVPAIGAALNIVGKLAQAFGELPLWAQKAALAAIAGTIALLVGGPITALIAGLAAAALVIDLLIQGFNVAKKAIAGFVDFLAMALITWLNDSIVKLNEFLEGIGKVADELSKIPGIDLPDIETLDTLPGGAGEERRRQAARDARRAGTGQNGEQRMTLDVKGDSPLADLIRRFTSEEQDRRERNQNRRAERQNATGVGR